jgi:hypothetical protein
MSLAVNAFAGSYAKNLGLNSNYGLMQNSMATNQAVSAASTGNLSFGAAHAVDKELLANRLQNGLLSKVADAEEESVAKQRDKNIAQSFNYMA